MTATKKKIESLTPAQVARFPEFVAKWTQIGLATGPADRPRAETAICTLYRNAGLAAPRIVWTTSLLACGLTRAVVRRFIGASVVDSVWVSVRDSVVDSVWVSVRDSVAASVVASVRASVRDSVVDSVVDSVWVSVVDSVGDYVRASGGDSVVDSVVDSSYGQHAAGWLSYYDYLREVCGLQEETAQLLPLFELAHSANWWLPQPCICWVSERPEQIRMAAGRLHCDGDAALRYPDGFSVWALHGVRVPQWLAELPATQLDPRKLTTIDNAQVRAEFVRKIGIDRICYAFNAVVLDAVGNYELLALDLGDGGVRPYLKMLNPSVPELWHVEGVPPDIQTVQAALNWRNQLADDQIDADHGADWYQQGDVILKPAWATKFKPQPKTLT